MLPAKAGTLAPSLAPVQPRQSPAFRRKPPRGFSPGYHQPSTTNQPRAAFTLIELLMVVMIIAVLFSIILSAIRTVERHTLQTVTQAEIKTIETAWKQYFAHYQMWPTNSMPDNLLGEDLAKVLRGDVDARDQNPDQAIFMEFTRFADHEGKQIPVNAWGESGRHKPEDCAYYVMFDDDGDNVLEVTPGTGYTVTNLFRSVAVWSFNPAQTETDSAKPKLLGSWMQ
jgi:prepilin-type N-terminal cleavage/methylation domain-containing protein